MSCVVSDGALARDEKMKTFAVYQDLCGAVGNIHGWVTLCQMLAERSGYEWKKSGKVPSYFCQGVKYLERCGWIERSGRGCFKINVKRVYDVLLHPKDAGELFDKPQPQDVAPKKEPIPGAVVAAAIEAYVTATGGVAPTGRIVRAFRQLAKQHQLSDVVEGWRRYCANTEAKFISPENYASKAGLWIRRVNAVPTGTTDEEFFAKIGA